MNHSYSKGTGRTERTGGTEGESIHNRFVKKMYVKLKKEHPTDTVPQIMERVCDKMNKLSQSLSSDTSSATSLNTRSRL